MAWQLKKLYSSTPDKDIKWRKGRGGKQVPYIEGAYVIKKLNEIFSPIGWDFEIIDEKETPKEVSVRGRLTIKDHKGHEVLKTQYGQHEKHQGVPLGDTLKAAATDSMKKCATLLGIGLDVYSKDLDGVREKDKVEPPQQNKAGGLMASEADRERIKKVGREIKCNTIRAIEAKTGLKIDWDNMTKVQASKILFKLMEKKAKRK